MNWECYTESFPIARKEHRCDDCWTTIKPGEKYFRFSGKWDGNDFDSVKQCLTCKDAAAWLFGAMSNAGCWPDEISYEIGDLYNSIVQEAREQRTFAGYRHAVALKKRIEAATSVATRRGSDA